MEQDWPESSRQVPLPSQEKTPVQAGLPLGSSTNCAMLVVQVPAAFAHDLHGVVQAFSQHRPSAQKLEAHSLTSVQVPPLARFFSHWAPLQK